MVWHQPQKDYCGEGTDASKVGKLKVSNSTLAFIAL
jgi:hypothetical protein